MPLFAFLIAEGIKKTHNVFLYMLRMLLAALVSEIPFNLMSSGRIYDRSSQNVMFTLLLGLLALYMVDLARKSKSKHLKIYAFIPVLFFCYLAEHFSVDYNFYGVLLILLFYFLDTSSVETRIWFLPALALFASRYIILAYWNGASVRDWDVTQSWQIHAKNRILSVLSRTHGGTLFHFPLLEQHCFILFITLILYFSIKPPSALQKEVGGACNRPQKESRWAEDFLLCHTRG